eukprot:m.473168 g.473168  ORF g.473168 m.473168 type:complete len:411 (-) comp33831_c0_seq1:100-1332(-)
MYPQYPRRQSTTRDITTATAASVPELDPPSPLTPPIAIVGATVVDGCVKTDGEAVGASLPTSVGDSVPTATGAPVPPTVGRLVGGSVKDRVGSVVGGVNGAPVGPSVPKLTGAAVCPVGARVSGASVGRREGLRVGLRVGVRVGVRVGMLVGGDVGAKDVQLKSAAPRPQLPTNSSWHEEAVGCTPQSKHLRTLDPAVPPGTHTPYWLLRQMLQENWKTTVEPPKKIVIVPLVALGITPLRVTVTLRNREHRRRDQHVIRVKSVEINHLEGNVDRSSGADGCAVHFVPDGIIGVRICVGVVTLGRPGSDLELHVGIASSDQIAWTAEICSSNCRDCEGCGGVDRTLCHNETIQEDPPPHHDLGQHAHSALAARRALFNAQALMQVCLWQPPHLTRSQGRRKPCQSFVRVM